MPSLRDEKIRNEIIGRLQRLTPRTRAKWGGLNAPRVLCHLSDALAIGLGDISAKPMKGRAFRHFPLKHLILYVLPFPKGAPTAREMLATAPQEFEIDRRRVIELINRLAAAPHTTGPEHPLFGRLTNDEWNALHWKHIDHHLKQFGC